MVHPQGWGGRVNPSGQQRGKMTSMCKERGFCGKMVTSPSIISWHILARKKKKSRTSLRVNFCETHPAPDSDMLTVAMSQTSRALAEAKLLSTSWEPSLKKESLSSFSFYWWQDALKYAKYSMRKKIRSRGDWQKHLREETLGKHRLEWSGFLKKRRGLQLTNLCISCCWMLLHMPSSKRTSNSSMVALSPRASLDSFSAIRNLNHKIRSREKYGQEVGISSFFGHNAWLGGS